MSLENAKLIAALKQSASFSSLSNEQTICTQFEKLKWEAGHGIYYRDPITDKIREADVIASKKWSRREAYSQIPSGTMRLVAEVKSAKGFHILFAPFDTPRVPPQSYWIGWEIQNRENVFSKKLMELGLTPEEIDTLLVKTRDICWPRRRSRVANAWVEPMPDPYHASAFREMNIGTEKDLDSSVLWRGTLALGSVLSGLKRRVEEMLLEDLEIMVTGESRAGRKASVAALRSLKDAASIIEFFHPVLVTDSLLWSIEESEPKQIDWCRFVRFSLNQQPDPWFDIVNADAFPRYAKEITRFYFGRLRAQKCQFDRKIRLSPKVIRKLRRAGYKLPR